MRARWNRSVGVLGAFLLSGTALPGPPDAASAPSDAASAPSDAASAPPDASARSPGVWQKHQFAFQFMGFTTTYSCDGLADKLKILLLAAGARSDAKSQPGACAASFGRPDKFARADLTFYTLAPAPAAAPAEAADTKPVNGVWRKVSFGNYSPRELRLGDCEAVDQFRTQVLPMFTTRNVENRVTCIPHQESGTVINLKFESFTAATPRHGRPSGS